MKTSRTIISYTVKLSLQVKKKNIINQNLEHVLTCYLLKFRTLLSYKNQTIFFLNYKFWTLFQTNLSIKLYKWFINSLYTMLNCSKGLPNIHFYLKYSTLQEPLENWHISLRIVLRLVRLQFKVNFFNATFFCAH